MDDTFGTGRVFWWAVTQPACDGSDRAGAGHGS
jgi:hypothetical protein